jgi:hypothetical protein
LGGGFAAPFILNLPVWLWFIPVVLIFMVTEGLAGLLDRWLRRRRYEQAKAAYFEARRRNPWPEVS